MLRRLPPLNALKAFEAAARSESFTRAAEELCVTQGAVSHQVKALEATLGVNDAFVLFRDKLKYATLYRFAAHRDRISWLERLFPGGVAGVPALTNDHNQAWVLHALALSYQCSDQPSRAVPRYRQAYIKWRHNLHRSVTLEDLGEANVFCPQI